MLWFWWLNWVMNLKDELKNYLNSDGQLTSWPSKHKIQMAVLCYLSENFEWGKYYSEKEVNDILNNLHIFGDSALLRRELFEKKFLDRKATGDKYWKIGNQISNAWQTERLIIKDAVAEEIEELENIYQNCSYIGQWTGLESIDEHPMHLEFEHRNLSPNGKKEFHRLQLIRLKEDGKIIGYLVLYHGFPNEKTFWLAVLAIHTDYQGKKLGQEAVAGLIKEVKQLQIYDRVGLTVGIKNWPALRFWINTGFDTIINFKGDKIYSEKTFADLWLVQKL